MEAQPPPKVYLVYLDGEQVHGIDFDLVQDNLKYLYSILASMYPYLDVFDLRLKIQRVGNTTKYQFTSPSAEIIIPLEGKTRMINRRLELEKKIEK